MQPIDYMATINAPDIGASLLQGLKIGAGIQDLQAAAELKQQKLEEAKRAAEETDRYNIAVQKAMNNPTPEAFTNLTLLNPKHGEAFANATKNLTAEQKDREFNIGMGVSNLINAGKIDSARSQLVERIAATENSGRDATNLKNMLATFDSDPAKVQGQLWFVLSGMDPNRFATMTKTQQDIELQPSKIAGEVAKNSKTQAEILKTKAETDNIKSEIDYRAKKFNLDADTLTTNTQLKLQELNAKNNEAKLTDASKKIINESVVAAVAHESAASEMEQVANLIDAEGGGKGVVTRLSESFKQTFGWQNPLTEIRNRYIRIRNSAAIKSLPPGAASDADIKMAMSGMPPETADASTIASFARGLAKVERLNAQKENAKSEWVSANGSLAPLARDAQIGKTLVPAGTTFSDYNNKFSESSAKQSAATDKTGAVQRLFQNYPIK